MKLRTGTASPAELARPDLSQSLSIRVWFEVLKCLEASRADVWEHEPRLVILPSPKADPVDPTTVLHGAIERGHDGWLRLTVALEQDPIESLATLIHEVAHLVQNPRHRLPHGYSWRRAVSAICRELTGEPIEPHVDEVTHLHRIRGIRRRRCEMWDIAIVRLLLEAQPFLFWSDDRNQMEAWIGDKSFFVPGDRLRAG